MLPVASVESCWGAGVGKTVESGSIGVVSAAVVIVVVVVIIVVVTLLILAVLVSV